MPANPFDPLMVPPDTSEQDFTDQLNPMARMWERIPNPFSGNPNIFPGDAPGNAAGPRRLSPELYDFMKKNFMEDWRAPLTKAQYTGPSDLTPDAQKAFGETPAEAPAKPTEKAPWEMTPEEVMGKKPGEQAAPEKAPWDMTPEELQASGPREVTLEQNAPKGGSGARGAPAQPVMSDRSSLYGRAKRADVGMEGVSAAARFNASLAWGAMRDPEQELEIARRAISRDLNTDYPIENLRIGPQTKSLEWINPKTGKWDLFAGAGTSSFFKDVSAALPELREAGAEFAGGVGGGAAGTVAGSPMGPIGSGGLGTLGNAAGSAAAGFYSRMKRLEQARERGLIDINDEQIFGNALEHATWVAGGTVAAATLLKIGGMIWKFARGSPASLLDVYQKHERLLEGKPLADSLESRAKAALTTIDPKTGKTIVPAEGDFPVTSGQQTALPEILGPRAGRLPRDMAADEVLNAESAAMRMRKPSADLRSIYDQQERTMDAVDFSTFAARSDRPEMTAGRILQSAMNTARERTAQKGEYMMANTIRGKTLAENAVENIGQRPTEAAVADLRSLVADAKEQLFMPFKNAYDKLEGASQQVVDLAPLRSTARQIKKEFGQDIIKSLDATQVPELQQALRAGLLEEYTGKVGQKQYGPRSIGELEKLRKSLNAKIRQLDKSTAEAAPRAQEVLIRLQDGIDASLEKSLAPEMMTHIHNLRAGFAAASEKFDRGLIGQITESNGAGGFKMSGNQVVDFLTGDPANARAFVDAIRSSRFLVNGGVDKNGNPVLSQLVDKFQPDMTASLLAAQQGVMAKMLRQFKNYDTGKWDTKGLANWLQTHNEANSILFGYHRGPRGDLTPVTGSNVMTGITGNITRFQAAADALEARLARQSQMFEKRFGVFTSDPAVLVRNLVDEGRVGDLRRAMSLVQSISGKDGLEKFKGGLAQVVRRDVLDSTGEINPQKVEAFLGSERGRVIGETLGKQWTENVTLLGDMMKVRQLQASGMAPEDLAAEFTRGVPGLRGMYRFLRVLMPPLSSSGRGLTGAVGLVNEKSQKRIGELLADPEKLTEFIRAAKGPLDPFTKAGKVQLIRLGFPHVLDFWNMAKNAGMNAWDAFNDTGVDESAGKAQFQEMGKERPFIEEPTPGSTPGTGDPALRQRSIEGLGSGNVEGKFQSRPGQVEGMNPVESDQQGPGGYPSRSPSAIATDPWNRLPLSRKLQLDSQGLTNMPEDTSSFSKSQPIPRSFEGAMQTLTPHFQMKGPGDEGFNPRESANASMRANEQGWLNLDQQQTTDIPKGSNNGTGFMYKLGEGEPTGAELSAAAKTAVQRQQDRRDTETAFSNDVFLRIAPDAAKNAYDIVGELGKFIASYPERWRQRLGAFNSEGATGKEGNVSPEEKIQMSRQRVLDALENDPITRQVGAFEEKVRPVVMKIISAVGGVASNIGNHLLDTMDTAMHGSGDEQHKAATELALIVSGLGYSRFPLTGAKGAELGAGGGRLPPVEPPRRLAANENMRDRLSTVEGGTSIVPKEIDLLSKKLSRALEDARDTMKTGKGDIPTKVDRVRGHIQELEKASDNLMREAESLSPPLGPQQYKDLKSMGMTEHEYRLQQLWETNAEIDAGKREAFQLMATGRNAKKDITPQNIKDWLEAAGVKNVEITTAGSGTKYVKFPDPARGGSGKTEVRVSGDQHPSGIPSKTDIIDTASGEFKGGLSPTQERIRADRNRNVSDQSYSDWGNLIEALKFRLSKSPDGQWLVSPDQAPRPGSFWNSRKLESRALEAPRDPVISEDPNQLKFDFGPSNPFSGIIP